MPAPTVSVEEFIALFKRLGTPSLVAKELGIATRSVQQRRADLVGRLGIDIDTWNDLRVLSPANLMIAGGRIEKKIRNGRVIVFSDAHYYPGIKSTAHRALLQAIEKYKPVLVINNGDAFDGGAISRYPRIGWDKKPTVAEEIEAVKVRLDEVEAVRPAGAELIWNLGNHDGRFNSTLAHNAPAFEGVSGFHLKDHFPAWKSAWRVDLNAGTISHTIIKHRWKGGIHATRNNALNAGSVTMVTGHLHSLKVTPLTTARGTCWGVDCGTLADPEGPQFADYTEHGVTDWRSGFVMLTYIEGMLIDPEMFRVIDEGRVSFRGDIIEC